MSECVLPEGYEVPANIASLEENLDKDGAQILIEAFLEDTGNIIPSLKDCLIKQDRSTLRSAAHMLKGCSASIQASETFNLAKKLETISMQDDWVIVEELVAMLVQSYGRLQQYLQFYLVS